MWCWGWTRTPRRRTSRNATGGTQDRHTHTHTHRRTHTKTHLSRNATNVTHPVHTITAHTPDTDCINKVFQQMLQVLLPQYTLGIHWLHHHNVLAVRLCYSASGLPLRKGTLAQYFKDNYKSSLEPRPAMLLNVGSQRRRRLHCTLT